MAKNSETKIWERRNSKLEPARKMMVEVRKGGRNVVGNSETKIWERSTYNTNQT